ncbi:MAG: hypothetical protein ABI120_18445 [Gemmatimonadaceae bacterium]
MKLTYVSRALCIVVAVALVASVAAVRSGRAQSPIQVRELSAPTAKSAQTFGSILGVREIANGKLLVNDARRRQLSVLDAKLANKSIVIDSVSVGRQGYGRYAAPIIPYLGDSTLFVDAEALSLVVLDQNGAAARVSAAPKPSDLHSMAYQASGSDPKGNLLYLGQGEMVVTKNGADRPDSQPVVRANFETRTVDTLGRVLRRITSRDSTDKIGDEYVYTIFRNPLPTFDGWAPLSDGTIAIVRGQDYHVDFVGPDGSRFSGPKMPFDWKRLTDADKQALIDSTRAVREKREKDPNAMPTMVSAASLQAAANGGPPITRANQPKQIEREVQPSEIPDFYPPLRTEAVKADADGNLWILPTTSAQSKNGELVYDVVNNRGILTHRVRMPLERSIAGFGKGGVVYLMYRDADPKVGWTVERTKIQYK